VSDLQRNYEDTLSAINAGAAGGETGIRQFLSFRVGAGDYAIDILAVREIKGWTQTTVLPNQPQYVRGVLNLRGAIVPVFDLRCRFGQGATLASDKHVVIIVAVAERLIGLLVDQVSDILSIAPEAVGPIPEIEANATVAEAMVVLLSLDSLFDPVNLPSDPSSLQSAA